MESIHLTEIVVNEFLQGLGTWLRTPFRIISFLGDGELFVLLLTALYWCFDQAMGVRVGIMLLVSFASNTFFKFLFRTPRPYWISDTVSPYTLEPTFGLLSGHSQLSASVGGWMSVEIKKPAFTAVAVAVIFLMGLSRVFLGVHFLTDVLLGWALGGLLVLAASRLHLKIAGWVSGMNVAAKVRVIAAGAVIPVVLIVLVRAVSAGWELKPEWASRAGEIDPFSLEGVFTFAGTWFGILTGYVWLTEKRGHFLASEGGWRRIARFGIGIAGVIVLWFGLGQVFPHGASFASYALQTVRYTLTGWWVTWIAPLVFEKIGVLRFSDREIEQTSG